MATKRRSEHERHRFAQHRLQLIGPEGVVAYGGEGVCRVGTNPQFDLRLPVGTGAPLHALLIPRGSYIELRTTGADASIELDGRTVIDSAVIRPGSTVRFGTGPMLRCEVPAGVSQQGPTSAHRTSGDAA